jgi:hypothetical protein
MRGSKTRNEEPLWAYSLALYGKVPPEILPMPFDCSRVQGIKVSKGRTIANTNWPVAFCIKLSTIIRYQAFQKDLAFLQFIISYAHYRRLRIDSDPPVFDFVRTVKADLMRLLGDELPPTNADQTALWNADGSIDDLLRRKYRTYTHPHSKLTQFIDECDRRDWHKAQKELICADLEVICVAWDKYAAWGVTSGEHPDLLPMGKAPTDIAKRKGPLPKDKKKSALAKQLRSFDLMRVKKAYILRLRRDAIRYEGGWVRGESGLFGEAVLVEKKGDVSATAASKVPAKRQLSTSSQATDESSTSSDSEPAQLASRRDMKRRKISTPPANLHRTEDEDGKDNQPSDLDESRQRSKSNSPIREPISDNAGLDESDLTSLVPPLVEQEMPMQQVPAVLEAVAEEEMPSQPESSVATLSIEGPMAVQAGLTTLAKPPDEEVSRQQGLVLEAETSRSSLDLVSINATADEAAKAIWHDISPGFEIVPDGPWKTSRATSYMAQLDPATSYWKEKGKALWLGIRDEVKALLIS